MAHVENVAAPAQIPEPGRRGSLRGRGECQQRQGAADDHAISRISFARMARAKSWRVSAAITKAPGPPMTWRS